MSTVGALRLPPEVNRILYVKNLPFKITSEEMYDIFGKYGPIRQIRLGNTKDTRGTAYVIYHDIYDAKNAVDHLSGFNVGGRYLIVLYYQHSVYKPIEIIFIINRMRRNLDPEKLQQEVQELRAKYGISK